ncbi:stage VI sporulation protein D [Neobacillus sp. FSL H8-0543]|uniref:stage VI sporulation protein D n=1 Tax=Neobacillus sp. FSL H8-0543 TaxID=2954672 RepID=UPI0031590D8A
MRKWETKGGVALSQENQSCLRFSLEESLWFRKGQEVDELLSISLDPDITIQENDQYVTIRGSLELTGEYKSNEENNGSEDESVANQKYVERVDVREEGNCEFSHRFPVDITIPNNRIQSIYDIDVIVDSFDYSFAERSCLKLSAELTISGLYDTAQNELVAEEEDILREEVEEVVETESAHEELQYEVLHRYQPEDEEENHFLFAAEAKKQREEEKQEAVPDLPTLNYQPQNEPEAKEEELQPTWSFQESRSEGNKPPAEVIVEQAEVLEFHPAEEESPIKVEEVALKDDESSSSPEHTPKHVLKKKASKKKTMTLTEFFARKEEGTEQAKVKMCIVQKGDTLDNLADRYDVSVPNLLRVNNLELGQDVYEGQVLYVPYSYAKK